MPSITATESRSCSSRMGGGPAGWRGCGSAWLLALAVAAAGCGGGGSGSPAAPSTPAPTPPPAPLSLRTDVSDPAGDALRSALLPVSPDLVSARLETSGGNLRLSARFTPSTFDVRTTIVAFYLDTDFNPSTGVSGVNDALDDAAILGLDYVIIVDLTAPGSGAVFHCPGRSSNTCRILNRPTATAVADGVDLTVSLSLLGNDDGRLAFKLVTWGLVPTGATFTETEELDYMPDVGLPAGRLE